MDFERALADPAGPAIASAEIAFELGRDADYVRVTYRAHRRRYGRGRRAGHRMGRLPQRRPR
jgi:hypothetical protein